MTRTTVMNRRYRASASGRGLLGLANRVLGYIVAITFTGIIGCGDDDPPPEESAASTRNHLLWKRAHAVEQDFARALDLAPEAVCTELGSLSCVQRVHLASLGGHDPFAQGLYRPVDRPLVTTPLVLDRVALAACGQRVTLDREGDAVVFTAIDLDGEAPAADSAAYRDTVTTLYRRFLARDPVDAEFDALTELLVDGDGDPIAADEFATLACFTVSTTTEFLFL